MLPAVLALLSLACAFAAAFFYSGWCAAILLASAAVFYWLAVSIKTPVGPGEWP